jgi:formate dehydrogenase subunit gamma
LIAGSVDLSEEEGHAAAQFLRDFPRDKVGRHLLKICRAESCRSMGCENLVRQIEGRLGIQLNQTTPDGVITFEHIFCLGCCRDAPSMMLDGVLMTKITPRLADFLIDCVS